WHSVLTDVGIAIAVWIAFSSLIDPVQRLRKGHSLSASMLGMCVAHFGLALFVLGATTVE
ncbi:cytochrome c-type biogenesis CcmF C-terminal domain-containing protein, partial [Salmonella enterica]|uniref:cytochrome c-type biogenesis CcmF C-terminal domain-containing protein n=1 Tax=Salmonella enterica TaxID=28901 RepID=UPI00329850A7